jgi:hypothetical protein
MLALPPGALKQAFLCHQHSFSTSWFKIATLSSSFTHVITLSVKRALLEKKPDYKMFQPILASLLAIVL